MAASWVLRRLCTAAAEAPVKATRLERLKNSKAGVWLGSLLSDYKDACREVVVGAWERPIRASVYLSLLGGGMACIHTKPDSTSFETALLDCSNQLGLLSAWVRNGTSDTHVQNMLKLRNEGRLRHLSLGLVSLTYWADYDQDAVLYEAQCSNLFVPWRELPQRVLDVGFAGRWWVLDSKMKDYDVNDETFKHLPAHMQATSPPSVKEVERYEKMHQESWMPLKMEEDEEQGAGVAEGDEERTTESVDRPEEPETEAQSQA